MAYRITPNLNYPIGNFKNITFPFAAEGNFDGQSWGTHLGVDISAKAGTKVFAIGRGVVVYSKLHAGEFSTDGKILRRNWGGIIIIAHKKPFVKEIFYSLYGHLGKRYFKRGDAVDAGDVIGTVGASLTESNGIWEDEHLHFSIYQGPFHKRVLPGYFKAGEKTTTKMEHWKDPINFINNYSIDRPLL